MRAALTGLLLLALASPAVAQQARLPRDVFDVIPPMDRVEGARGDLRVVQEQCRVGPTEWARRRIVDVAVQEWAAFGFQTIDARPVEAGVLPGGVLPDALNPPRAAPRQARHMLRHGLRDADARADAAIAGYWSATADGARVVMRQNRDWAATDLSISWRQPWSAAFISWVMCEAGLGDMAQFERHISHRVYVDQAIHARDGAAPDAAFVAHDAGEVEVTPGDMLCNGRATSDYRSIADRRREAGEYAPLHCDIVVRVDHDAGLFHMIGGNVMGSVSLTLLPGTRDGEGPLRPLNRDDLDGVRVMFAHLKLRSPGVEPNAMDQSPTIRAMQATGDGT